MSQLKGARTEKCLKDAFAIESQVKLRYTYFANKADLEGKSDVEALFRSSSQGENCQAQVCKRRKL